MSSFPQSTLKYDKRNLYPSSAAPISEKISALPPSVMVDIRAGLEFEQKEKIRKLVWPSTVLVEFCISSFAVLSISVTYFGSKRPTRHFHLDNMPKWEQDEYAREIEYMKKTENMNKLQE